MEYGSLKQFTNVLWIMKSSLTKNFEPYLQKIYDNFETKNSYENIDRFIWMDLIYLIFYVLNNPNKKIIIIVRNDMLLYTKKLFNRFLNGLKCKCLFTTIL